MEHKTTHTENLLALKRIEGQTRGIQKMIENKEYCIDIVTQIHAAANALYRVSEKILEKHIEECVVEAFKGRSGAEKDRKIKEITTVIKRLHKAGG